MESSEDIFSCALRRLHISAQPTVLPCRDEESAHIRDTLRLSIVNYGGSKPIYVSGVPGTGKTATVLSVINSLKKEVRNGTLRSFEFVEINCLRLLRPVQAYTTLWSGISNGDHLDSANAIKHLERHFQTQVNVKSNDIAPPPVIVCLLDEVDFLLSKDDRVIFQFLSWPLMINSGFVLICVANIMDLPERLSNRLKSRIGGQLSLERLVFKTYSPQQIEQILKGRLEGLRLNIFENTRSLEMIARKASVEGSDIRSALKICQRYDIVWYMLLFESSHIM